MRLLIALFLLGCTQQPLNLPATLPCNGPSGCNGNPCCYTFEAPSHENVTCFDSPTACPPQMGVDTLVTRLCAKDDDCTAGAASTQLDKCCPATVEGVAASLCRASCGG